MAAATLTYRLPGLPAFTPGATPPTKIQASQVNEVVVDAVFADGATIVNMVHNMQLNATGADGTPRMSVVCTVSGSAVNVPILSIVDGNTVSIAQTLGSANTGATYRVSLQRPLQQTK